MKAGSEKLAGTYRMPEHRCARGRRKKKEVKKK
jgi:hypothetical protein